MLQPDFPLPFVAFVYSCVDWRRGGARRSSSVAISCGSCVSWLALPTSALTPASVSDIEIERLKGNTMRIRCLQLISAALLVSLRPAPAATLYVNLNNPTPAPPFSSWATAATNIQDAVDAAGDGDQILVTNGVYRIGGKAYTTPNIPYFLQTNRVEVIKPVEVRSCNGPGATVIEGYYGGWETMQATRCAYLTNGAVLTGFTLTNGGAIDYGGGVFCVPSVGPLQKSTAVLSNCMLINNWAYLEGGGAFGGTLNDCLLTGNSADRSGGASRCTLNQCVLSGNTAMMGGGASLSTLNGCTLIANSAERSETPPSGGYGGGAYNNKMNNCLIAGNSAYQGGGACNSTLINCTVVSNSASSCGGGVCTYGPFQQGTYGLTNSIIFFNTAPSNANCYYVPGMTPGLVFRNSCTTPLPSGAGNITNAPLFVDAAAGNFRLQPNSPCINAGNNAYVTNTTDLDGKPAHRRRHGGYRSV